MKKLERQSINIITNKYCYFCEKKHNNWHSMCDECFEEAKKEFM